MKNQTTATKTKSVTKAANQAAAAEKILATRKAVNTAAQAKAIDQLTAATVAKTAEAAARKVEEAKGQMAKAQEKAAKIMADAKARAEKLAAKVTEKAAAKEIRGAEALQKRAEKADAKEAKKNRIPVLVTQLDEHGQTEQVDKNVFQFEVKCTHPGCSEIRFVTLSGLREATMCKPHARKARKARRVERLKNRAQNHKAIVEDAIAQGLFPKAFLTKYGLA